MTNLINTIIAISIESIIAIIIGIEFLQKLFVPLENISNPPVPVVDCFGAIRKKRNTTIGIQNPKHPQHHLLNDLLC